ncbi:MAG: DEAD/DEAH box helicase, partial [bacterium]|nr:DEAD/DEAH box helicase [bacterium]
MKFPERLYYPDGETGSKKENPVAVDKATAIYMDSTGRRWAPKSVIAKLFHRDFRTINPIALNTEYLNGLDRKGRSCTLYPLDVFEKVFEQKKALPHVDEKTGIYTDSQQRQWATTGTIATLLKRSESIIRYHSSSIASIEGAALRDKIVRLFPLDAFSDLTIKDEDASLPRADEQTGIYTDTQGRQWMTKKAIAEMFGTFQIPAYIDLEKKEKIRAKNRANQTQFLYPSDTFLNEIKEYKNLPQADSRTHIYADAQGVRWAPIRVIARLLNVSAAVLKRRLKSAQFIDAKDAKGRISRFFQIDSIDVGTLTTVTERLKLPAVDETGIYTDAKGLRWASAQTIADMVGVSRGMILNRVQNKPMLSGRDKIGKESTLYPVDSLIAELAKWQSLPHANDEGVFIDEEGKRWAAIATIATLLDVDFNAVAFRTKDQGHREVIDRKGQIRKFYLIDPIVAQIEARNSLPRVDSDGIYTDSGGRKWASRNTIATKLGVYEILIKARIAGKNTLLGLDRVGRECLLYDYDQFSSELKQRESLPHVPDDGIYTDAQGVRWASERVINQKFGFAPGGNIASLSKGVFLKALGQNGHEITLYPLEVFVLESQRRNALPRLNRDTGIFIDDKNRSWATLSRISNILGLNRQVIGDHAKKSEVIKGLDSMGRLMSLYPLDQFDSVQGRRDKNKELEDFLSDPSTHEKLKAFLKIYGSEYSADFVHQMRPDFVDIPKDRIKGHIAELLGEYLPAPGPSTDDELKVAVQFLKNENAVEILTTVIKHDCLEYMLAEKKKGTTDEYFSAKTHVTQRRVACASFMTPELARIFYDVEDFFCSRIYTHQKPSSMVHRLKPDRLFPDIYQRINCRELVEKKRLLIADEMGVGKSASAIFAKESLKVSCALVVVPANVEDTWKEYLGDDTGPNGEQIGYFKKGQKPAVLMIRKPDDLDKLSQRKFDYIVISQEKLSEEKYMPALMKVNYQMLIVDEVHKVKKEEGARAGAVQELSSKIQGDNKYLALLSGTPVPNKVEDVAMLLRLLHPTRFTTTSKRELMSQIIQGTVGVRSLLAPYTQMKSLAEHIEMPRLTETTIPVELSPAETKIYQALLQDDEYTPSDKIRILRQFLLNPKLLHITPPIVPSKIRVTGERIEKAFEGKRKVVMFVNGFISDVMRGPDSIIPQLNIPSDVRVEYVHGANRSERDSTIKDYNSSEDKVLLVVSGATMDVGVNLSAAEHVIFYNDPWTLADKHQQLSRVFRPGLKNDLTAETIQVSGTIEEGINKYLLVKHHAIEKILRGGIVTAEEQEFLRKGEKFDDPNLEINAELAKFYFS